MIVSTAGDGTIWRSYRYSLLDGVTCLEFETINSTVSVSCHGQPTANKPVPELLYNYELSPGCGVTDAYQLPFNCEAQPIGTASHNLCTPVFRTAVETLGYGGYIRGVAQLTQGHFVKAAKDAAGTGAIERPVSFGTKRLNTALGAGSTVSRSSLIVSGGATLLDLACEIAN